MGKSRTSHALIAGPAVEVMMVPMAERKTNMDFIYSERVVL